MDSKESIREFVDLVVDDSNLENVKNTFSGKKGETRLCLSLK
jgi:hypothetical protein